MRRSKRSCSFLKLPFQKFEALPHLLDCRCHIENVSVTLQSFVAGLPATASETADRETLHRLTLPWSPHRHPMVLF